MRRPMVWKYGRLFNGTRLVTAISTLVLIAIGDDALADPENVTAGEIALLPPYCAAKPWNGAPSDPSKAAYVYWLGVLGEGWKGVHHYCWGLVSVRRALMGGVPKQTREHLLFYAINDYKYVLNNSPPTFVLLPEIWLRIAEASALRGDNSGAIEAYERSRRIKSDYWPAYTQSSELLVKLGQRNQAKKLALEGLQIMPENKELANLYRSLGGDPSTVASKPMTKASEPPVEPLSPAPEPTAASAPRQ